MLISEFSRATGLTTDTIRYYVREGLLHPATGQRGASRPYQEFSAADERTAAAIRIGQALGMSLTEIRHFVQERRAGRLPREAGVRLMREQRERMEQRLCEMQGLLAYMDAKIAWMEGCAPEPVLVDFLKAPEPPQA